tara:strand:- start:1695 stop:3164 length:1470 start_codon:yes stop_codon:yes gene_type:complete
MSKISNVRVRFAPSPTGDPHLGAMRTALFNWAFARKNDGKFILRIEDTDRNRLVPGSTENIIEGLKWLNLIYDEGPEIGGDFGPYFQSERKEMYLKVVNKLLDEDKAYMCDLSSEELEKIRNDQKSRGLAPGYNGFSRNRPREELEKSKKDGKPVVVRLKVPISGSIEFNDLKRGKLIFDLSKIDDFIILKADGMPTYHLANVVDDSKMEISHVLRGEEWISSTPKHLLIYDFINAKVPEFIHLPLIFGKDKSKLSKRHGANSIIEYKKQGLLPNALLNYLALLGWSPGNDLEFLTPEDISKLFEIKGLSTSPSIFDAEKLSWINGVHIREMNDEKLANIIKEEVEANSMEDIKYIDEDYLKISSLIKERIKSINDIYPLIKFFFDYELPKKDLIKCADLDNNEIESLIKKLVNDLSLLNENNKYDTQSIEELLRKNCKELNLKVRDYLSLIRNCITGSEVSPPLFESIEILGIKETNIRLNNCLNLIS